MGSDTKIVYKKEDTKTPPSNLKTLKKSEKLAKNLNNSITIEVKAKEFSFFTIEVILNEFIIDKEDIECSEIEKLTNKEAVFKERYLKVYREFEDKYFTQEEAIDKEDEVKKGFSLKSLKSKFSKKR